MQFPRTAHAATPEPKSGGPGLGMGWAPLSDKTFKLTEFEKMRCDARMPREQFHRQGRISPEQRHRMLMAC